jgi:hypothetical protein
MEVRFNSELAQVNSIGQDSFEVLLQNMRDMHKNKLCSSTSQ